MREQGVSLLLTEISREQWDLSMENKGGRVKSPRDAAGNRLAIPGSMKLVVRQFF